MEHLQKTARWIVSSSAVVAATLLAGLSLASLGRLELWRVAVVGAAVLAAVAVVGAVMRQAAIVMTARHESTRTLARRTAEAVKAEHRVRRSGDEKLPLSARVASHDEVLTALYENRIGLFKAVAAEDVHHALRLRDEKLATAGSDATAATELRQLDEALWEAGELGRLTLADAAYNTLIRVWLPIAAVTIVAAAIGIAWLSTPPRGNANEQITPATVLAAVLYLNSDVEPSTLGLGDGCSADRLAGTIVGGTIEKPMMAIHRDTRHSCEATVVSVDDQVGVVVPTPP